MTTKYGGQKSVDELLAIRYFPRIKRNCDGSCCQCGACCDRVLSLTPTEIRLIHKHLVRNKHIQRRVKALYKDMPHRMCPFFDYTKADGKCMIYRIKGYPMICDIYNCDESKMSKYEAIKGLKGEFPEYVDMWHEFFGDPIDISRAWRLKDLGAYIPTEYRLQPERLNEFFQ